MGSSFFTGAMNALSKHIMSAAETERKKREDEENDEKAVFESLLKSPDPKLQEIGLAGLMEKPKRGWLGRRVTPKAREQVRQYLETAQAAQEQMKPAAPMPSAPMPPPAAAGGAAQPTSSPTQGGAMTLTPGVPEPPPSRPPDAPPPDYSMVDPTSTGGMEPIEDIQARLAAEATPAAAATPAPPPSFADLSSKWEERRNQRRQQWERDNALNLSGNAAYKADPIQEALDYAEVFGIPRDQALEIVQSKVDPLGTRLSASRDLKEYDWQKRGELADKTHGQKLDLYEAQNTVPIDEIAAAEFGLPAGTRMDKRIFQELARNTRQAATLQQKREMAQTMLKNYNMKFLFNEKTGNTIVVDPRSMQVMGEMEGVRSTAPSFTERQNEAIDSNLSGDLAELERLTMGRDDLIGWFDSKKQKMQSMVGAADPAWLQAKYLIQNSLVNKLKAMSGAAVSPSEAQRLLTLIPDIDGLTSNEQKFRSDLAMFQRELKQSMAKYKMEKGSGGPPAKPGASQTRRTRSGVEYTVWEE